MQGYNAHFDFEFIGDAHSRVADPTAAPPSADLWERHRNWLLETD
jgi:hypothetical protein